MSLGEEKSHEKEDREEEGCSQEHFEEIAAYFCKEDDEKEILKESPGKAENDGFQEGDQEKGCQEDRKKEGHQEEGHQEVHFEKIPEEDIFEKSRLKELFQEEHFEENCEQKTLPNF